MTKDGAPAEEGHYKANVDVMMAIDALELSIEIRPDVVILVTGDADFAYLAIKLRRHGIRVEVASVAANLGNMLSLPPTTLSIWPSCFGPSRSLKSRTPRHSLSIKRSPPQADPDAGLGFAQRDVRKLGVWFWFSLKLRRDETARLGKS